MPNEIKINEEKLKLSVEFRGGSGLTHYARYFNHYAHEYFVRTELAENPGKE
jgi:hypothetical protein